MSNAFLCPVLKQSFTDNNGVPLAGAQLFTYTAGTSTPQATYTDQTALTPNTNPVIFDSSGRANVWLGAGSYKMVLEDSLGNVIFTVDNVTAQNNGSNIGSQNVFTLADNQSSLQNITGMLISNTANQCVTIEYTIIRSDGTNKRREHGYLYLTYDSQNGWILNRTFQGADALNMGSGSLQITSGGQVQYESDSMGGTYAGKLTWQINTAFPTEGI
jgi:hypothetical protein